MNVSLFQFTCMLAFIRIISECASKKGGLIHRSFFFKKRIDMKNSFTKFAELK